VLQARVDVAVQLLAGEAVAFGIRSAEQYREASAAITKFLPPFQGLGILETRYYPGPRSGLGGLPPGARPPFALPWAIFFRAFGPFRLSLVTSAATAGIRASPS